MPNHIHFVLWLVDSVGVSLADTQNADTQNVNDKNRIGAGASPVPNRAWVVPKPEKINTAPALGDVVGAFKSLVFKVYLEWIEIHDPSWRAKFWQRNYYEHIVRNERELDVIRRYIIDNPKKWKMDRDNLGNMGKLAPPEKVEDYLQDIEETVGVKITWE